MVYLKNFDVDTVELEGLWLSRTNGGDKFASVNNVSGE